MTHTLTNQLATPRTAASRQLCGLDLIRFAAALLVVVHHLGFWVSVVHPTTRPAISSVAPYTWAGWIGVEIFFVLSCFVIAYSAERASAVDFVISRAVRLYPAAWICSTLSLILFLLVHQLEFSRSLMLNWLSTLTLLPYGILIEAVYWTLRVEIVFYAVVLFSLITKTFNRIGQIMTLLGLLSTGGWAYTAALAGATSPSRFGRWVAAFYVKAPLWDELLARFAPFFAIGVLLWLCLFRKTTVGRILAIALCAVGCLLEIRVHAHILLVGSGMQLSLWTPVLLWLAALVGIVASVKFNQRLIALLGQRGVVTCRTLGLMTYPLYLVHAGPGLILMHTLHGRIPDLVFSVADRRACRACQLLYQSLPGKTSAVTPETAHWRRAETSDPRSQPFVFTAVT